MVLLTMTPAIVRAIETARDTRGDALENSQLLSEPSLAEPEVGKPISHSQLIDISKLLKQHTTPTVEGEQFPYHLNSLLKGSKIYIPPPPPKKEPTPEYKALMERLRREEEARAYERMIHPPPVMETFEQRFPASPLTHFDTATAHLGEEVDDVTYAEVHRQMVLIINIIVSIIACSAFIWIAARHWSVPQRLGLSMSGSAIIAIAEVVVYNGYIRQVNEAKLKEKKKPEIKEITETWVIDGAAKDAKVKATPAPIKEPDEGVRYRKGKHR